MMAAIWETNGPAEVQAVDLAADLAVALTEALAQTRLRDIAVALQRHKVVQAVSALSAAQAVHQAAQA